MALKCEKCGRKTTHKSERFCRTHRRAVLESLEKSGYLDPLQYQTASGTVRLSRHRFLTVPDEDETVEV